MPVVPEVVVLGTAANSDFKIDNASAYIIVELAKAAIATTNPNADINSVLKLGKAVNNTAFTTALEWCLGGHSATRLEIKRLGARARNLMPRWVSRRMGSLRYELRHVKNNVYMLGNRQIIIQNKSALDAYRALRIFAIELPPGLPSELAGTGISVECQGKRLLEIMAAVEDHCAVHG
tara:strand:- start:9363 stop:9896 length:534 start_codon:yes stop_codon:yes gene_type:complete